MTRLINSIYVLLVRMTGGKGHRYITSGFVDPGAENYYYFKVLSDASVTYVNKLGGDNATTKALTAGDEVLGYFTTLTVASGEIRAYIL